MIRTRILSLVLATGLAGAAGCASGGGPSGQLLDARRAYAEAAASAAPTHARKQLLAAHRTLRDAEIAHREDPGSGYERHLAYLATRRAQIATARASAIVAQQQLEATRDAYASALERQGASVHVQVTTRDGELAKRNQELAEQNKQLEERTRALEDRETELARQAEALQAEREAREKLERERDDALSKLKDFAEVVENERGTVITLGGALLFRTNETTLLPTARDKLDQVAKALQGLGSDQSLVIEGHADSRGSKGSNRQLSSERAEAVRAYLISRGVEREQLISLGKGEEEPIATNKTAEGRANNRRVEIVISRPKAAAAPVTTPSPP